jgi:tetratricopeptide (TPR) repeat protein
MKQALQVLTGSAERDRRSRHKSLIRIARIHLGSGRYAEAELVCKEAAEFCRKTFGNPSHEALFWQAASLYRLERYQDARAIVVELSDRRFRYPNFNRLTRLVHDACREQAKAKKTFCLVK